MSEQRKQSWWESLRHIGLLLNPAQVSRIERDYSVPALTESLISRLRRDISRLHSGELSTSEFISHTMPTVFGFKPPETGWWYRGGNVSSDFSHQMVTGEYRKPQHIWKGREGAVLPVFIDSSKRIGQGRGRKTISDVIQWLRWRKCPLALVTNGRQWRLIHTGLDYDAQAEADIDLWFEEGAEGAQLYALRQLLQPSLLDGDPVPLAEAIAASRRGHAELSAELGERAREAVETLVHSHGQKLKEAGLQDQGDAIYRAAVRIIMRMVVVLFAESRDLLPRGNTVYHQGYSLQGMAEQLNCVAVRHGDRLKHRHTAWPRILALFKLVYEGCEHESLPIPSYGGSLFAPGVRDSNDPMLKALHVLEKGCFDSTRNIMPDKDAHLVLRLLTQTTVRVRQGRGYTTTTVPVDFKDLSTEYIGILYQGLLDYELRTAPEDDAIIFLDVGNEPALPLSRLENMGTSQIKSLLEGLKDTGGGEEAEETEAIDETSEEESPEESVQEDEEELGDEEEEDTEKLEEEVAYTEDGETSSQRERIRERAVSWTRTACEIGALVRKPRGRMTPEQQLAYENKLQAKAKQLVRRMVLPGEWYLVRWGGTRKGSGTFYTPPQLAVPTVQRTLHPLCYNTAVVSETPSEEKTTVAPPRKPEEILDLKVCDPACGSGSFLVGAVRYLTDALLASLYAHGRFKEDVDQTLVNLLGQQRNKEEERLADEFIPCRPEAEEFPERLEAVLRRHVVEHCVYGVDSDPLAVELCRLSLWVETLDRKLPFSFLDHKIKCGNSLVGGWFDQFLHYPAMAWKREGGDSTHNNGVHFKKEEWTKAIKTKSRKVKDDLINFIKGGRFREMFPVDLNTVKNEHAAAVAALEKIHKLGINQSDERAEKYRQLRESPDFMRLLDAFDLWCALWFWPPDQLEFAPMPTDFASDNLSDTVWEVVDEVKLRIGFFHWELEFPDVFNADSNGFDALLGNPPWETLQPVSKEFFSSIDPLYRSYGKQAALAQQKEYFRMQHEKEKDWLKYVYFYNAMSNWMKHAGYPFGDHVTYDKRGKPSHDFNLGSGGKNSYRHSTELHERWQQKRKQTSGYADNNHPFRRHGGGKAYTYMMFLEQCHALAQNGGRLGLIVPSGLYSDHGSGDLRELFLEHCRWEWLFSFENREGIFDIHRSYKFNPVIVEKGARTEAIQTAFMRRNFEDWENAEHFATPYAREQVVTFSPYSKAILEIQSQRDLEVLTKIYSNSVLLGDDTPEGWGVKYAQGDFNMTSDSALFPPRPVWEEWGYRPDEYSRWIKGPWKPISELWNELGVDTNNPEPAEVPDKEQADIQYTDWQLRCAQPPYDRLPVPRADIPAGVILSREADAWIREDEIPIVTFTETNGKPLTIKEGRGNDAFEREITGPAIALPLYEGRMIGQFDFSKKGWVSGKGRSATWRDIPWERKVIEPQYLMGREVLYEESIAKFLADIEAYDGEDVAANSRLALRGDATSKEDWLSCYVDCLKTPIMNIGSATNSRTVIGSNLKTFPCNHALNPIRSGSYVSALMLNGTLQSFAYDSQIRMKLTGLNISFFILDETAAPRQKAYPPEFSKIVARLSCPDAQFATEWLRMLLCDERYSGWKERWSLRQADRTRFRCIVEAIVMATFKFDYGEAIHLLRGCDFVSPQSAFLDPKGFWRVDKEKPPEQRLTVLSLVAFHDLQDKIQACGGDVEKGIEAFCKQNDGEGWMLPETLRLADYGLGHDDRAKEHQPVRVCFGPRFYDWQLAQSLEESWRECHLHARNLLGEKGYQQLLAEIEVGMEATPAIPSSEIEDISTYIEPVGKPEHLVADSVTTSAWNDLPLFESVERKQHIAPPKELPNTKRIDMDAGTESQNLILHILREQADKVELTDLARTFALLTHPEDLVACAPANLGAMATEWQSGTQSARMQGLLVESINDMVRRRMIVLRRVDDSILVERRYDPIDNDWFRFDARLAMAVYESTYKDSPKIPVHLLRKSDKEIEELNKVA